MASAAPQGLTAITFPASGIAYNGHDSVKSLLPMRPLLTVLLLLFFASPGVNAETLYITDTLQLGLHRAQNTGDRPFANLLSGTAVEVLERVPNYARVRTPEGQEGWVKSAFLVTDKPAKSRLNELEAELEAARTALRERETALVTAEETAARMSREMQARGHSAEAIQETLARLKADNEAFEAQLDRYRGSLPLAWVLTALALVAVAGFVAGWWALDRMIRRRHGGFRIY